MNYTFVFFLIYVFIDLLMLLVEFSPGSGFNWLENIWEVTCHNLCKYFKFFSSTICKKIHENIITHKFLLN